MATVEALHQSYSSALADACINGSCCRCRCCVPEAEAEADTGGRCASRRSRGATLSTVDARSLSRPDRLHRGSYCDDPCTCRHQPTVLLWRVCKWRRAVRDEAQQPPDTSTHTLSLPSVLQLTAFDISATRAPTDAVEACSRTQASPCPACSSVKCLADVLLSWCLYRHVLVRNFFLIPSISPTSFSYTLYVI